MVFQRSVDAQSLSDDESLLSALYWFDDALQAALREAGIPNVTRTRLALPVSHKQGSSRKAVENHIGWVAQVSIAEGAVNLFDKQNSDKRH